MTRQLNEPSLLVIEPNNYKYSLDVADFYIYHPNRPSGSVPEQFNPIPIVTLTLDCNGKTVQAFVRYCKYLQNNLSHSTGFEFACKMENFPCPQREVASSLTCQICQLEGPF